MILKIGSEVLPIVIFSVLVRYKCSIRCSRQPVPKLSKSSKLVITELGLLSSPRSIKINNFVNNFQKLNLISCSFSTIFPTYDNNLNIFLYKWFMTKKCTVKKIKVVDKTKGQIMPSNVRHCDVRRQCRWQRCSNFQVQFELIIL